MSSRYHKRRLGKQAKHDFKKWIRYFQPLQFTATNNNGNRGKVEPCSKSIAVINSHMTLREEHGDLLLNQNLNFVMQLPFFRGSEKERSENGKEGKVKW